MSPHCSHRGARRTRKVVRMLFIAYIVAALPMVAAVYVLFMAIRHHDLFRNNRD
jgi:hypothetical protein